CLQVYRAPFTF
nr:immunoglobulin light chain junction region [Macaca mulatta]MOX85114.1 immunoglobulin light chain junction region [Macaca mulatta]MOX85705.1 immunoglobulin light chain junction region [Macaca mulatta]MOX85932.1 immunoglobulin light chain junction region [Macaca mulatta]MOX86007.1 immunoglobulin light chain junction region [Macaca mulatta]